MSTFRNINRHGYSGIEVDGSWLFYSPKSKRLAVFPSHESAGLTQDKLDTALSTQKPSLTNQHQRKRQIGFINTNDCHLRCVYCFNNGGESQDYLKPEIAEGVVKAFIEDGLCDYLVVKFFGGEPTLNMSLIRRVVALLDSLEIKTSYHIVSAGYISQSDLDWMIKNRFVFTISIDGQEDVQQKQRPFYGNPEGLLTPVQSALRLSETYTEFKIRVTVTGENVGLLPETIEYFAKLGANVVHVEPITLAGRGKEGVQRPDPVKFAEMLMRAVDVGAGLGIQVINSSYMNLLQDEQSYCSAGKDHIVVGAHGEISRCYELADPCDPHADEMLWGRYDELTGHIKYNNEASVSSCASNVHIVSPACINCFSASVCGGGCPSRNLADADDIHNQGGYFCQITRRVFPAVMVRIATTAGLI